VAESVASILVSIGVDAREFTRSIDAVASTLDSLGDRFTRAGAYMTGAFTVGLTALAAGAINAQAEMDALARGLTAVTGSSAEAARQMERLKEVARLPGLGFEEAVKGSIALQNAGLSAVGAERALKAFGNAIATTGGGKAQLGGVITQLGQMANATSILTGDLKPIITQAPLVAQALRDMYGTISAEDIRGQGIGPQKLIEDLVGWLEKAPQVTGGMKNAFENMGDTIQQALLPLGQALQPAVMAGLEIAAKAIEKMAAAFAALPPGVQTTLVGIGAGLALIGPALIVIGQAASGASALMGLFTAMKIPAGAMEGITGIASAMRGLVTVPFALIAEGFTAIGAAIGLAGTAATVGGAALVAAVVAIGAYIVTHWESVKGVLVGLWADLGNIAESLFGGMVATISGIWEGVKSTWAAFWGGVGAWLGPIFGPIITWMSGMWDGVVGAFKTVWNGAKDFLVGIWQSVADFAGKIWGWIVAKVSWAVDKLAKLFPETAKALKTGDWSISMPSFGGESSGKPSSAPVPPATGALFTNPPAATYDAAAASAFKFGAAVREATGPFAVHIEMFKLEKQRVDDAEKSLAKYALGLHDTQVKYREFMKTWTEERDAAELDALSASINSGVDVKDYNKHLLSSVPGMSGLFIDPTNVKVMENMLKVQIASRDAFKEQDKAAKQYADDERTLGISRINTIREMQDAYSALHLEQERGSVREVKARENILRAMVQEGQALSSAQARWLVYRDIVQDSATNMLRFWQNIRGAVEDAFGSISGVSADVIFGGDPGGASQKLGKAAKEAEEYYKNTLKAAEANAKNSPEVQAAYNAMIAAQQRLNNLSANAPSNTRKRLEEDLKIAAKRHEQLLESATQAAQTADSVTAAYERMLKAQERAADPTFWDRLGAGMKEAFTGIGKDLLQTLFDTLLNPLKQGLSNVLFGGKDGKGGLLGGVLGGIGGLFGGGNGGGGGALPGITNHAASLALGGLGKIGSSAASSATGMIGGLAGMANPIGAIGGAVGAVSSVISNFQMAGMNKSLDIIVKHTLQTVMIGEATFYLIENRLTSIHDRLASMLNDHMWRLHDIWDQLSQINLKMGGGAALAGAGGPALTALVLNEYDKERLLDELANLLKSRGQ
jgi:tape measure domain-containing protein